jgi:DNA topoisomerase I
LRQFQNPTTMMFDFRAKSGKEQRVLLSDPRLAAIVHFGSTEVNAYLRAITNAIFTAKDSRTWGGTVTAAEALVNLRPPQSAADAERKINAAIDAAAQRLNNTRAVCRKSYVSPRVPESYVDGSPADSFSRDRKRPRLSHAGSAVCRLVRTPQPVS